MCGSLSHLAELLQIGAGPWPIPANLKVNDVVGGIPCAPKTPFRPLTILNETHVEGSSNERATTSPCSSTLTHTLDTP